MAVVTERDTSERTAAGRRTLAQVVRNWWIRHREQTTMSEEKFRARVTIASVPAPAVDFLACVSGDVEIAGVVTTRGGTWEHLARTNDERVEEALDEALKMYSDARPESDYSELLDEGDELAYCVHADDFVCPEGCQKIVLTWMD